MQGEQPCFRLRGNLRAKLTSSLVVCMVAMSQVCMHASPDTEMAASPAIPNSIMVACSQGEVNGEVYKGWPLFRLWGPPHHLC